VHIMEVGESRAVPPYKLKLTLAAIAAASCNFEHTDIHEVRLVLSPDLTDFQDDVDVITVLHSELQLRDLLSKPKNMFLWVSSTALKHRLTMEGFDPSRLWVVNPWSLLDVEEMASCAHIPIGHGIADAVSKTKRTEVFILSSYAVGLERNFQKLCSLVRSVGLHVTCMHGYPDHRWITEACSADIVIFFFDTGIPEWLLVEYFILQNKIVLFDGIHDRGIRGFFKEFAYTYDTIEAAFSTLISISKNLEYFSSVAGLSSKALRKVVDIYKHDDICLALHEYGLVKYDELQARRRLSALKTK
jgi:hypothetical protein